MKQILITRFNIKFDDRNLHLNDVWLKKRLKIFKDITLPSIEAAALPNDFTWVLLTSPDTPAEISKELKGSHYRIVLEPNEGCIFERLRDFTITTRLDSDDAVMPSFFYELQSMPKKECWINFESGYKLIRGVYYEAHLISNPFISRISKVGHVHEVEHHLALFQKGYKSIDRGYMWVQNCHPESSNK